MEKKNDILKKKLVKRNMKDKKKTQFFYLRYDIRKLWTTNDCISDFVELLIQSM